MTESLGARGAIYVASGTRYIRRVSESVTSLKRHMPNLPVTLFSDRKVEDDHFDNVEIMGNTTYGFTDKVVWIPQTPYEHTLFLDADTFVTDDISELFLVLEQFDLAVAHDTFRIYVEDFEELEQHITKIPESFPMLNSGVILFKKNLAIEHFFRQWLQVHQRNLQLTERGGGDQPAFREALYYSDLKFAILPSEYNCRIVHPVFLNRRAKILHGPHHDLAGLAKEINREITNRVFIPGIGTKVEGKAMLWPGRWYWKESRHRIQRVIRKILGRTRRRLSL